MTKKRFFFVGAACAALVHAGVWAQEVTACRPLAPPIFSLDQASPTLTLLGLEAADVLQVPGPTQLFDRTNLAMLSPLDELDALSFNDGLIAPAAKFVLTFSVDRTSLGAVPPDPVLIGMGFPFNVQEQALKRQAPGDEFMSLRLFDRSGPIGPNLRFANNNTLVRNQRDAGGVDYDLLPDLTPFDTYLGKEIDELDAGARPPTSLQGQNFLYYSLRTGSPSLGTLPGTGSGADIYIDFNPNALGGEQLYAPPFALGLQPDDDIDALIIFDDGDQFFEPGIDMVLFSLTPDSPSLGVFSPADVFVSFGTGVFNVYAPANLLGLRHEDNLDMLELALCSDVLACVQDWAIGTPCARKVPAVSEWGLAVLATALLAAGALLLRNQRPAAPRRV